MEGVSGDFGEFYFVSFASLSLSLPLVVGTNLSPRSGPRFVFRSQIWHQSYQVCSALLHKPYLLRSMRPNSPPSLSQRSLTVLSTHVNRILHIPSLFFTFFVSAVLHHAGTVALLPSLSLFHSSTAHFFLLQPFAIFFERFILFRFLDRRNPLLWVWTVGWILGSGGLIFEENVRGGLWEVEGVPFSVVRWVAGKVL